MIKIGIVGTGHEIGIAQLHIKAYKQMPDAKIMAIYDNQDGRAAEYAQRFSLNDAKVCSNYEELLQEVDAVSICTPNSSHVELAEKALSAGKHVLCEKPFGVSSDSCKALTEKARTSSLVTMIGLCYRGIPEYRYLKWLVENGDLGQIYYTRQSMGGDRMANVGVKLEWRMRKEDSGPGAAADFGSHMLDAADWILRPKYGKFCEIMAMAQTYVKEREYQDANGMGPVTNDDVAFFTARTETDVLCSFTASRIGGRHTFEIYGSKGFAIYDAADSEGFSIMLNIKEDGKAYTSKPNRVYVPEELYLANANVPKQPFVINFYHEIREFLDGINKKDKKTEIDFARGLYIQRLIDSVNYSARFKAPVKIDF